MCKKPGTERSLLVAMAAVFIAAISPASAIAAVVSPQVVRPSEVTAHAIPSSPSPSQAPKSPAPRPEAEPDLPSPVTESEPSPAGQPRNRLNRRRRYVVPRTQYEELREEAEIARQFANAITGQGLPQRPPPDLTLPIDPTPSGVTVSDTDVLEPSWTEVFEEVLGQVFDWFCPRSNHQRADGAVEDPHATGSCF
jgi:hypothetical protein